MYMVFGWGENPTTDDLKYRVSNLSVRVAPASGMGVANCVPNELAFVIRQPRDDGSGAPLKDAYTFAKRQLENWKQQGCGKIVCYNGEEPRGNPLQEIRFSQAWLSLIDHDAIEGDTHFTLTLKVEARKLTISGVEFEVPTTKP